jgi:hypothetical protein
MSDVQRKCTPQEIEAKRRQALEKFKKSQEQKKTQRQNTENRLKLPAEQADVLSKPKNVIQSTKSQLTEAQRAQIEQKRVEAIERAKANKLISETKAAVLKTQSTPPGKSPAPSRVGITQSRSHPYLKPQNPAVNLPNRVQTVAPQQPSTSAKAPSSLATNTARVHPYQKPAVKSSNPLKPVHVSLEMISDERFVAKTDTYSDPIINEFKKLRTKSYGEWDFIVFCLSSLTSPFLLRSPNPHLVLQPQRIRSADDEAPGLQSQRRTGQRRRHP